MILLEGSDRTGKTTVAEQLMRLLPGWAFVHSTRPPVDSFSYFGWRLMNAHPKVVMDRLHWSDYCYGKAYDGAMRLSAHQWRLIELTLLCRKTTVIYMTDNAEAIEARWGKDEMYGSKHLRELLGHYWDLVGRTSAPVTSYVPCQIFTLPELVAGDGPTDRLRFLAREMDQNARTAEQFLPPSLGIGSTSPGFMIVGEAPPNRCEPCGDVPRFPLDRGPAAEWLWKALDEVELRWWEGYYTNAASFVSPKAFAAYTNYLRPQVVLALGAKARELVNSALGSGLDRSIRPHHVEHPQHQRRFNHRDFASWRDAIGQALAGYCQRVPEVEAFESFDIESGQCG